MSIRKRGNSYMADVKVAGRLNPTGQEVRARVAFPTQLEAIRAEAIIRAEIMRLGAWTGETLEAARGVTTARSQKNPAQRRKEGTLEAALALAWDHPTRGWKHSRSARSGTQQHTNAKAVIDYLGPDRLCVEVTIRDFERAIEHLAGRGNSNDTITRKLQAFYRVLWFAQRQGWIKARPEWDRPTPGKPRQFIFTPKIEQETIAYFEGILGDREMADLFRLGIDTGCRLGELLRLSVEDVNLEDRFLTLKETKNGETRTVILNARACEVLGRRLEAVGDFRRARLFPGWTDFKVSRRMLMAREGLGFEGNREFTFHATRHTCGTRMAEKGVDLTTMMDQLGHKTPSMTQRYIKLSPAARRATLERMMSA